MSYSNIGGIICCDNAELLDRVCSKYYLHYCNKYNNIYHLWSNMRDMDNKVIGDEFSRELDLYLHWYNEKRIKKSLGYLSPVEYRRFLGLVAQAIQENVRTPYLLERRQPF